jgi:hypothetical protein
MKPTHGGVLAGQLAGVLALAVGLWLGLLWLAKAMGF